MLAYRIEHSDYWERPNKYNKYAVVFTKEDAYHRFSLTEIKEMFEDGCKLYEYYLENVHEVRGEYAITKDDVIERKEVSYKIIWNNWRALDGIMDQINKNRGKRKIT